MIYWWFEYEYMYMNFYGLFDVSGCCVVGDIVMLLVLCIDCYGWMLNCMFVLFDG